MKHNKKYTTIAIYACIVILFAALCVYIMLSIERGSFSSLGSAIRGIVSKIFIGAIIAYILNPIVTFFENFVFVSHKARKQAFQRRNDAKKNPSGVPFTDLIDATGSSAMAIRKEKFDAKLRKFEQAAPPKGLRRRRRKAPVFKEHPYRGVSILCTFLLLFLAIFLIGWVVLPQLGQTVADLIRQIQSIRIDLIISEIQNSEKLSDVNVFLQQSGINLADIFSRIRDFLLSFLMRAPNYLISAITTIYQTIYDWIIGIIFAIYFLVSKDLLFDQFRRLLKSFCSDKVIYWTRFIVHDIDNKFGKFIEGKIVDSLIIGILSFIAFTIFRIPYAAMIALIVGVTNIIPFFGPFIGAIPSALIILISEPSKLLLFIILILCIQQLDGNLIGPYILGDSMELPPVWIMIAIITMGGLFGIFGMFFGVPIFAVIFTLIKELADLSAAKKERKKQAAASDTDTGASSPNEPVPTVLIPSPSEGASDLPTPADSTASDRQSELPTDSGNR